MNSTKQFQQIIKSQNNFLLFATLLAGALLIAIGFVVEPVNALGSKIVLTFGSSLLGTSFGILFNSFTNASVLLRVRELLENSAPSVFNCTDADLQPFRQLWHSYLLTQVDGAPVWRYRRLDFSRITPPKKLYCTFEVEDPLRPKVRHSYEVEGYVVASRLVLGQRAGAGSEPPMLQVFPAATERYAPHFLGSASFRTWDRTDVLSHVIMSETQLDLGAAYAEGSLSPALGARLDALWAKDVRRSGLLPPGQP